MAADDDGVIRIGTEVDISDLRAQMAQARAPVQSAARNMAEAQAEFGKAAAAGNEQAAEAVKIYRDELAATEAELSRCRSQLQSVAAVTDQVTASTRGMTSVAALAGREIGGGMGGALGRVLSQTGMLGDAMATLTPAFIGVAAVDVFGHMIQQAVELYDNFVSLDAVNQQFYEDIRKLQQTDFVNVHSLEVANERLKEASGYASSLREIAEGIHSSGWTEILSGNIAGGAADLAAAHAAAVQGVTDQKNRSRWTRRNWN
jgi:hypothetical protein